MRFPVGTASYRCPFPRTSEGILRYFNTMLTFIEQATAKGNHVLIHCFAGAHRAGSTGIAWLMYAQNLNFVEATKLAKSYRPLIDPIG